jgi:hypothetical protein
VPSIGLRLVGDDVGGVDDDRLHGPVPVEVEPQDEEGGLGGDDRADLVGEGETPGGLPPLLLDDRLHELSETLALGPVEESPVGHAPLDDLHPVVGKALRGPAPEEPHLGLSFASDQRWSAAERKSNAAGVQRFQ